MASLSKQSSAGKPKLERRNARKISDYEPSDSPRTAGAPSPFRAGVPSPFRALDKGSSKSFRVLGIDSQGEIDKICEELGIDGGADAFSITQDAWEAGKAKSGSLDRFILEHKTRSRSFDEPPGSFLGSRATGAGNGELASSPMRSLSSPFYNSMSSSSGDSFASDSSLVTGEKGFFGSLDTPRELAPVMVVSETGHHNDRQQPGNVIQPVHNHGIHETQHLDDRKQTGNVARDTIRETRHQDNRQTRTHLGRDHDAHETQHLVDRKWTGNIAHDPSIHETRRCDNSQTGNEIERVSNVLEKATCLTIETSRQPLLPPPGFRVKPYLPSLSTEELIASFGPDESDNNDRASDHDDTSHSDPEDYEVDVIEDKAREEFGFVSEVVQQHGVLAKEQTLVEDTMATAPSIPEHANMMSIQSWRKLDMLGSGSFGTVYEGMSEDGVYFAVKEVSLSEHDSKAQQCVIQLEQEIEFLSKFQHENIVRYLGTQKESDKLYIFLELVTKGSLSSLYQKYTLFESQIRSYTRQILNGLKYLHERKVMHRDIKCANILVDVTGKIKVADFGLAKQISQLDELKSCKGSAYWMAPEVVDPKKTYSFPADIWSLGCTVLEMETRRPPFGDLEWHRALWKVGHGEAPPIPATLSEDAKDFIGRCLEVNPARRPSAMQLLDHPFVQYVGGTGLTPRNSFTQDTPELPVIAEDKTFDG